MIALHEEPRILVDDQKKEFRSLKKVWGIVGRQEISGALNVYKDTCNIAFIIVKHSITKTSQKVCSKKIQYITFD